MFPKRPSLLFPWPPRRLRWARPALVVFRSVHLASMALVLGGIAYRVPDRDLTGPVVVTVASGLVLVAVELARSGVWLYQGAGVAALLKVVLLGLGHVFPEARLPLYLAATLVASAGSHMSGSLRHYSLLDRRVLPLD